MKKQFHIFLTAVMFYTRIPCPSWVNHSEEMLNRATIYFPFIGWIVGGFGALIFGVSHLVFPNSVAILLSMISTILLTGAFHEDGFGDVCDGFGGGWTKEKILTIMKDSRMGAYGVIGLLAILAMKYASIDGILSLNRPFSALFDGIIALLIAHPLSRLVAVWMIFTMEYARENDADGKAKPVAKRLPFSDFLVACFFGLAPLSMAALFYQNPCILLVVLPLFILKKYLEYYFKKWIDGYTGDCLGATQQMAEVLIYLSLLIIWKFC
ncbi:MAG: adenosylcobinamide-GDP ribazoletransferase [Saprospiraceae bacterium]|nr:adenosylcobinamide-GDP ribazoletransferase [Saprospiraceae bacterium]